MTYTVDIASEDTASVLEVTRMLDSLNDGRGNLETYYI